MKKKKINAFALRAGQLLTFILTTLICLGVAVSPAQALDTISDPSSELRMGAKQVAQIALADLPPDTTLVELGSYNTSGSTWEVAIADNIVYIADSDKGLEIVDVSNPEKPFPINRYQTPGSAKGVVIADNIAYVANSASGLEIVDVSNPEEPKRLGSYNTPGSDKGVAIVRNTAYLADKDSGLQIINVKDPENPEKLSRSNMDDARRLVIVGDKAYVADGTSGLRIIDVSNPEKPFRLGRYDTPGDAKGVAIAGHKAYVADGSSGLQIIDVSKPKNPELLGSVDTPGSAFGVVISDNRDWAFVADGSSGLQIIDVSKSRNPILVGGIDTPGNARAVVIADKKAYIADSDKGLRIIGLKVLEEPTVQYGESFSLENQSVSGNSYLNECDSIYCLPTTESSVVTDLEPDQESGTWIFKSATGISDGNSVSIGDLVYLQNQQSANYMNVCGFADPSDTSFRCIDVVTDQGPNPSAQDTGTWKIVSAVGDPEGTPLSVGDLIYLQNQWSDSQYEYKGYLDVYGSSDCRSTSLSGVATDVTQPNEPNWAGVETGTWKIKTVVSE